jgi:hypothetical protein
MSTTYDSMTTTETEEQGLHLHSRVTVEHALYFVVALIAAILRLPGLGASPLSPTEAIEALAIWDQWQPASELIKIGSPIYFSLTGFVSQVLGFSDEIMRLVPALFGIGLVLLPWFLRHRTGKLGALIASLLMAVSPTLTFASRTVGGESAALFFGLLIFIAWLRYQESAEVKWFYTLTIATALGLTTAPIFYGFLFSLLLAWLAQATIGPALLLDENGNRLRITLPTGSETRTAALLALGAFILVATSFLLRTDGIGAAGDLIALWIAQFTVQAEPEFWLSPFLAILRYELVLIIIGLPALIWSFRSDRPYPFFLAYWLGASLLLLLLQRGVVGNLGLVMIPGLLLIGTFSDAIIGEIRDWRRMSFAMVILIAGGIIYVNLSRYGRLLDASQTVSGTYNILLVVITLMATVTLFAILWGWDKETVKKGVLVGFLLIIVMVSWSIAWWIGREGANDTRELLVRSASDDDLLLLASTIGELSWQLDNSERGVQILSIIESPALRWYLRDFTNLELGNALRRSMDTPLIITTNEQVPELANSYIGSDFGFTRLNSPQNISMADLLRWWLFHESHYPMPEERLILWLRADLVEGVS